MKSFFICHSSGDKVVARAIAAYIKIYGQQAWIDEGEILIGDSLIDKISSGMVDADFLIAVISKSSIYSNWVKKELNLAMTKEVNSGQKFVLPVLVDDCQVPFFLQDKLYLDFRDQDEDDRDSGIIKILQAAKCAIPEIATYVRTAFVNGNSFVGLLRMSKTCSTCQTPLKLSPFSMVAINDLEVQQQLMIDKAKGIGTIIEWSIGCPNNHAVFGRLTLNDTELWDEGDIIEFKCLKNMFGSMHQAIAQLLESTKYKRLAPGIYVEEAAVERTPISTLFAPVLVSGYCTIPEGVELGPFAFVHSSFFPVGYALSDDVAVNTVVHEHEVVRGTKKPPT